MKLTVLSDLVPSYAVEGLIWAALAATLLLILNTLYAMGVLDPVTVMRCQLPRMLIATMTAEGVLPQVSSHMADVAMIAANRGVEEEHSDEKWMPARGHLIGEFMGALCRRGGAPGLSEHGVVLEVGTTRATEKARQAWEQRLSRYSHVTVRLIAPKSAIVAASVERSSSLATIVARWRLLRRLERRIRDASVKPVDVTLFVSPRHRTLSMSIASIGTVSTARDMGPLSGDQRTERGHAAGLRFRRGQSTAGAEPLVS